MTLNQGQTAQKTSKYLLDENTSYAQVLALWEPDVNDGGTSLLQARMAWGGGLAPIAMWRKGSDGTFKVFYPLTDGQESVRQLTDAAGLVTDSYYYDAWGNALAGGSGDTKNPFRYTGQMLDSSGKYFVRARYYDPATGRFLSHDPLASVGTYTLATPVKIDGIPIELVFGGKGAGRIVGMGVRTSQANQLFRVDFGLFNPNHGHGKNPTGDIIPNSKGAMRKSNEIAAWNDSIFHYHVLGL